MGIRRCRRMQITCNNPLEKGFTGDKIKEIMKRWQTEYYCFCYETGEQGTYHFHLYTKFRNPQSVETVSKAFGNAHVEMIHSATSKQNRDYVLKEGAYQDSEKKTTNHSETFYESCECPVDGKETQGARNDLEAMDKMLNDGMTPSQILLEFPFSYARYEKDLRRKFYLMRSQNVPPMRNVTVYWHVGDSGTGKSYTYVQLCEKLGEDQIYLLTDYDGGGFDNYCGEPILILEEFKAGFRFQSLLNILDSYKIQVHARYANVYALWNEVHITSVFPPEAVYNQLVDSENQSIDRIKQLLRRIDYVVYHYIDEQGNFKTFTILGNTYKNYEDLKERSPTGGFMEASPEDANIFL